MAAWTGPAALAQTVTYAPYIQLGDNGTFGPTDQIVIAWQTNETSPKPGNYAVSYGLTSATGSSATITGRVVDNYLSADPTLAALSIPTAYGAHVNYYAVLSGLNYATTYYYKVTGAGMPSNGFTATFNTRKQGSTFSFIVQGDEGFFPAIPNNSNIVNYEARIAHLMNNVSTLTVAGLPPVPPADIILNTGDNIYNQGSEDNYRDFFFPVLNNDTDSNETGAPILRSTLFFVADGNHDVGSTGVSANLLADNSAPLFSGNNGGGDALAFFNNLYYPLNGPVGYDIQNTWNFNTAVQNGMLFTYKSNTYSSPAAINAFRASTTVNTGGGTKQQIDHMSNYSFDYANTHFLFLDANPHLFNGNLPGGSVSTVPPPPPFTAYPPGLLQWVVNDLDSTKQTWKVVVYHQPGFSSGDATELNHQMRAIAEVLEDHGVNVVFNGHEHNYQRTLPIRSNANTPNAPYVTSGGPAALVDTNFNGTTKTVPNGVLYIVEGAGGNRDFDGDLNPPRGSGLGVDQDDAATGLFTVAPGFTVNQGPADWLDTFLTNLEMVNIVPTAGQGAQKITTKFKSKLFSFGDVQVNGNSMTLYQISEPLQSGVHSGLYGTDVNGNSVNDPIADTVLNGTTGSLVSTPATGTSALLDAWTITKPSVSGSLSVQVSAPPNVTPGGSLVYSVIVSNNSTTPLNGVQVRLTPGAGIFLAGSVTPNLTVQGPDIVATMGHMDPGASSEIQIATTAASNATIGSTLTTSTTLTSGTAQPVAGNSVSTTVISARRLF
jgi:uncharacterized repeat protein (TIGR01451 family)